VDKKINIGIIEIVAQVLLSAHLIRRKQGERWGLWAALPPSTPTFLLRCGIGASSKVD
jgi:hypothetical protein